MKLKLRESIEIVGLISIVASLLFVGMQLRLDQRIAIAAQFHERSVLYHDGIMAAYENDAHVSEIARSWEDGFKPNWWNEDIDIYQKEHGYTADQMRRDELNSRLSLIRFNNNYFQYEQGFISEETWQGILGAVRSNLATPFGQAIALSTPSLEPGFIKIVNEIIDAMKNEM